MPSDLTADQPDGEPEQSGPCYLGYHRHCDDCGCWCHEGETR